MIKYILSLLALIPSDVVESADIKQFFGKWQHTQTEKTPEMILERNYTVTITEKREWNQSGTVTLVINGDRKASCLLEASGTAQIVDNKMNIKYSMYEDKGCSGDELVIKAMKSVHSKKLTETNTIIKSISDNKFVLFDDITKRDLVFERVK